MTSVHFRAALRPIGNNSGQCFCTAGEGDVSDGVGWFIPFTLAAGGLRADPECALAELPGCGGQRGWDDRAGANFRRWAEPRGKQPAGRMCCAVVPTSTESERCGSPRLKMLLWVEEVALHRQLGFPSWGRAVLLLMPKLLEGQQVWGQKQGQCPGCLDSWFALSRTWLSPVSFCASVSPWPSRRRSPPAGCGGGRRAGRAQGSSPGSAKPYYFPTTVSSSLLVKLDPAVHNSH